MEPTPDPAVSDTTMGWEQLEQLISGHLFGAVRDNQTVWCEAPGTRYVQYSCIGEDGFDAEAVGPEFIEAGPDFYTSERTETLARLGFSEPQPNFMRGYEASEWQEAASAAVTILRDVLVVAPGDVHVHAGST